MFAARIGEIIGAYVFLLLIASLVLFVNRKRANNPTPYIAAGVMCIILSTSTSMLGGERQSLAPCAGFFLLLTVLARYEAANTQPSGLSRLKWIGFFLLSLILFAQLDNEYGIANANGTAYTGSVFVAIGVLWRWVRMVPMIRK